MTTATTTKNASRAGKVTVTTVLNNCVYAVTDTSAKTTATIGSAGRLGWYCTISRYGRNWKHMTVSGTDNPASVYETCFHLGTRFELDGHEWMLPTN